VDRREVALRIDVPVPCSWDVGPRVEMRSAQMVATIQIEDKEKQNESHSMNIILLYPEVNA
jgi:hypothetical protein